MSPEGKSHLRLGHDDSHHEIYQHTRQAEREDCERSIDDAYECGVAIEIFCYAGADTGDFLVIGESEFLFHCVLSLYV